MFSLIRSDQSVFCCISEIKLSLALNCLRVQSWIVLECMSSVLSIDMFVDLNSFVCTFRTGFHYIFNGARFFVFKWFNILKCPNFVFGTIFWEVMYHFSFLFFSFKKKKKKKRMHTAPFAAAFICLFYATWPLFQLNNVQFQWRKLDWELLYLRANKSELNPVSDCYFSHYL